MVGRFPATIAPDEAHHRSTLALTRVEHEVADDQSQMLEVPIECFQIAIRLQHHMAEALDQGRRPGCALSVVDPWMVTAHVVVGPFRLSRQCGVFGEPRDDPHERPTRVSRRRRHTAQSVRESFHADPGGLGEAMHVRVGPRTKRRTDEGRTVRSTHDDAWGTGFGAA